MAGRLEYKYLVPNELLEPIRAATRPHVHPDPLGGLAKPGEYTVRSIYYDTLDFNCYHAKLAGLKVRNKFRIRGYDQPGLDPVVFLEIKKRSDGFIDKHRGPVRWKDLASLLASRDIERYIIDAPSMPAARRDAERFLYHYVRFGLHPAVLVVYDRQAVMARLDASLRITFDTALRRALSPSLGDLYDDSRLAPAMNKSFIFELKFFRYALPGWVRALIAKFELPRMALSKYTICLEANDCPALSAPGRGRRFARRLDPVTSEWGAAC